jgi:hypothetical protein
MQMEERFLAELLRTQSYPTIGSGMAATEPSRSTGAANSGRGIATKNTKKDKKL